MKVRMKKDKKTSAENTNQGTMDLPKEIKKRNYMLIKPSQKWYDNEIKETDAQVDQLSRNEMENFEKYAAELMSIEKQLYQKHMESRKKRSDYTWVKTVLKTGTISDRMAAMTLLVQDSPVHNLQNINNLINMVTVKTKRECLMAIDTLRDLFLGDLLLQNRKLKKFSEHSFSAVLKLSSENRDLMDKQLLLWHFEDELKKLYVTFVDALDKVSRDVVESMKIKAVWAMFQLLISKSEHEQILLNKLVNKLGDPKHKVAAFSVQKLNQLMNQHPNMMPVMVVEVEHLLFRPNINPRAQYYGICFLNQMLLSPEDKDLASHLIAIYFGFFKACIKKKEVDTKMMSALLTGVNRAYPFAQKDNEKINEQIDTMFNVVHTVRFQISVQALMLIYHVLDAKQAVSDRFYSAVYRKILDPQLKYSTRLASFFNLLFKSLQLDDNIPRLQAFVKRLLQICHCLTPPTVCAILILISEIAKKKPKVLVLEQQLALNADDSEEHFMDVESDSEDLAVAEEFPTGNPNSEVTNEQQIKEEKEEKHAISLQSAEKDRGQQFQLYSSEYMPLKRNPRFANAGLTCTWELVALSIHSHPSVALFAQMLLKRESIVYTGDPLQDFTLIRFLDRFVYRNPKSQTEVAGVNPKHLVFGRRKQYKPSEVRQIPANTSQFIEKREKSIPVDEVFLYHYFAHQADRIKQKTKIKDEDDSDVESVDSDEFEEYLSKYEPGGGLDDLDDLDFKTGLSLPAKRTAKEEASEASDSDSEEDFEADEEFNQVFKEFDSDIADAKDFNFDEEMAFPSDEEYMQSPAKKSKVKLKTRQMKSKKQKKNSDKISTAAESAVQEFAEMMDENAASVLDTTSVNALANKDNADVKQLKWEMNRDRWIRNGNWKNSKHRRLQRNKGGQPKFNRKSKPSRFRQK